MPKLFISYKRGTSAVIPLIEKLRLAHYDVWYDKLDIHAGQDWQESINQGLDQSDAVLVALTPDACKSEFVGYEVQRALQQGKAIFPLKFEKIDEQNDLLRLGLSQIQFIDFTLPDIDSWEKAFQRLLSDMAKHPKLEIGYSPYQITLSTAMSLPQAELSKELARLNPLTSANPAKPELLIQAAICHLAARSFQPALSLLKRAQESQPLEAKVYYLSSIAVHEGNRPNRLSLTQAQKALELIRKAIDYGANSNEIGLYYLLMGMIKQDFFEKRSFPRHAPNSTDCYQKANPYLRHEPVYLEAKALLTLIPIPDLLA